jgi:transglutaminase-like putative cysteine protease
MLDAIRRRLDAIPQAEPEDSITLRLLVQLLVTVGIVATDVAAMDVLTTRWWISLWAVPMSAIGAAWSYYGRRRRNVPVKFCIAIAMLLALLVFFVRLLAERNDTRLALAELLIQLQVFHSFDLPRRKDLGYSMMIGLILIGVAATLSQTLIFGPLLLLFLAIALPTLMLDYRARLGLLPKGLKRPGVEVSVKKLAVVLVVIVGLGLAIFAMLPRFPGYQLRNFPVSATIDFNGEFDGSTISNPGYVNGGIGENADDSGGVGDGPGSLDSESYYGFNSRINQNLRGTLVPKVVMRVRSQAPGFWRVLAFDRYTGQGWEISRNSDDYVQVLQRPGWTFRFLVPWSVALNRTREIVQSYTVVSTLPNLIPVLYEPKQLYFPTEEVAIDQEGGLRSPLVLSEGLTYTVISEVPYRDRTVLRQAETNYSDNIRRFYLQIPEAIADRVRQHTTEILAESPNPITEPYEQALFLAQYLKQNYSIQPDVPFLGADDDLVEAFLFRDGGGYPDHFSTVLTIMLRSIGVPARLVAGFGSGEFNPFTGLYIVRNTDAYAMTEVYFSKYGWFTFDPIPGHEVLPPSITDYETFGVLRQIWNWIAGWLPSPVTGLISGFVSWLLSIVNRAIAWISSMLTRGWMGGLFGLLLMAVVAFLGWLLWTGIQLGRDRLRLRKLHPMEALYQRLLGWLALSGNRKTPTQTPLEYVSQISAHHPPPQVAIIDEISMAYVRWRYGNDTPNLRQLQHQFKRLKQMSSYRRRWRRRF